MTLSKNATFISLELASEKYNLSENVLLDQIKSGTIASVTLTTGEILVADKQVDPSLSIRREEFEHLRDQKIAVREAAKKYNISSATISRWGKSGYIQYLERGYRAYMDEADVAYCVAVYNAKRDYYEGQMSGVPIFNKDGTPYQAKHPEVAAYKRAVRDRRKQRNLQTNI